MDPLQFLVPLDWIEAVGPIIPVAILVVVLVNLGTRFMSYRAHARQAEAGDDDEAVARYLPHTITNIALLLLGFLFILYRPVSGMIMTIPIVGLFIVDFFELEARQVEARNDFAIELPKAAIFTSSIVLIYALYYGLRFLYGPYVDLIFA